MKKDAKSVFKRNRIYRKKRKLAAYTRNKNILYFRIIHIEYKISFFLLYYLPLDGFQYVYLNFDSVFYLIMQTPFRYLLTNS